MQPTLRDLEEIVDSGILFAAIDYTSNGEGRSIWLYIDSYCGQWEKELLLKNFVNEVSDFYVHLVEELTEEEFFNRYDNLVPATVKTYINTKPIVYFRQELHING